MSEGFNIPNSGVIYFGASWCPPCKQVKPFIKELKQENKEIHEIDVEENSLMAEYFQVVNVPTFVSVKNGKEYDRRLGAIPKKDIENMLKEAEKED